METTLGGERLGSGNKQKLHFRNYERSTHDLGYIWRSTMSSGTLVPFLTEVALPGDTFDIDLDVDVLTHPTIGPLFGSYKVQLDVFQVPVRLYQGMLHMNKLGIGMDMGSVYLPVMDLVTAKPNLTLPIDNQQVNPSHIYSYLNIRGAGYNSNVSETFVGRTFNAIPFLAYWDIYKNYYANKQEEIGAVIHREATPVTPTVTTFKILNTSIGDVTIPAAWAAAQVFAITDAGTLQIIGTDFLDCNIEQFQIDGRTFTGVGPERWIPITEIFSNIVILSDTLIIGSNPLRPDTIGDFFYFQYDTTPITGPTKPRVVTFDLNNIDTMRQEILQATGMVGAFNIGTPDIAPYNLCVQFDIDTPGEEKFCALFNQEGLGLKTYQSDLFNNWIDTEWIDGVDGISAVTAVDVSGGSLILDELNLAKKVYDMLNRIATSGGTYDDWLDAVYTHERTRSAENPMYIGGLSTRLVFQEVISNSASDDEPLGTLAGRGRVVDSRKGGKIVAKIDEPSYIMGIVSLTPIIDYSQGNKWDVNLQTMNDFHKPALDAIGFQDLITEQMAWWDSTMTDAFGTVTFKSAGKQPAWINYMTNVNQVRGNFADQTQQMFMVLNRRYEATLEGSIPTILDLTTYIDPSKFNHIFADTRIDAQNFWVQIKVDNTARRKMSAKVIPNL